MTSETDEQFVERISREVYPGFDGWRTVSMMDHSLDRLFALARRGAAEAPKGFTAGWVTGRADAAKVAEDLENKWSAVWRKGLKCDSHLEGMSDGAGDVADAIRALPPPPAGETEHE